MPAHFKDGEYERIRSALVAFLERRQCFWAEELADEAMYRIWMRFQTDPPEDLRRFAYGVARNVYNEWWRKQSRLGSFDEKTDGPAVSFDPVVLEQRRRLREALAALPEGERNLLLRYFAPDRSSAALGRELGLTAEGIRGRIFRTCQYLRKLLGGRQRKTGTHPGDI